MSTDYVKGRLSDPIAVLARRTTALLILDICCKLQVVFFGAAVP